MPMQTQKNVAFLCQKALRHNVAQLRKLAPNSKLLGLVKADAYGHGMLRVSEAIGSVVDGLAVATVEEGCTLRLACPNVKNIVVMEGALYLDELILAAQHALTLVLHHEHELILLAEYAALSQKKRDLPPIVIWVQIDVGMHRLGFLPDEIPQLRLTLNQFQQNNIVDLQVWMTHFSASEDLSDSANQMQLGRYQEYVAPLPGQKSMANSAAILQMPESHQDWIRPGLILYGASPIAGRSAVDLGFQPVMTLMSQVLAVRTIPAGTRIGYNGIWEAKRESVIATIGIGYGDGYPRHIAENTPVAIAGKRFPIVGRVSMDMMMVDITDNLPDNPINIGTSVELWGEHILTEEIAKQAKTLSYELFCQLTKRVHFDWKT